jgi:hypothetical protein
MSAGRGLRPAHNRDCPGIGADGRGRETALAQTAARQHDWRQGSLVLRVSGGDCCGRERTSPFGNGGSGCPDALDTRQTVLAAADAAHPLA